MKTKHGMLSGTILLVVCSASLSAQWGKFQDPAVPRDGKGQVRIDCAWTRRRRERRMANRISPATG
jgi:hypothetical protein